MNMNFCTIALIRRVYVLCVAKSCRHKYAQNDGEMKKKKKKKKTIFVHVERIRIHM